MLSVHYVSLVGDSPMSFVPGIVGMRRKLYDHTAGLLCLHEFTSQPPLPALRRMFRFGISRCFLFFHFCFQEAVPAGAELCGGGDMALSIADTINKLRDGDEDAAVYKRDLGELMLRPL